jgi:hypothetical protein
MNLKEALYQFCKDNDLNDIHCIIHIALLNYVSNLSKSPRDEVNISPKIFDSFVGIGLARTNALFQFISNYTSSIDIYYEFDCLEKEGYSFSILKRDIQNEDEIVMDEGCSLCDNYHTFSLKENSYKISYIGYKKAIIDELSLNGQNIRDFMILNTNENNFEKLAKILVSNLKISNKEKVDVEKGLFKYMQSIKKFTGLVADISDDGSKITGNVKNMIEDLTLISSVKDIFKNF